ncbi:MAG TPA: alpha-2-macroglobulin family protein [Devosia sp.]|nr:alpha-2-macroglobulin family protein [Devosia sp.]
MRLLRSAGWLVALVMAFGFSPAMAQDRSYETLPDTDLPGFDYAIEKDVTLKACQTACVGDRMCSAFTYNSKSKWCFLKGAAGEPVAFKGATSGTIKQSQASVEERLAELPFPAQDIVNGARGFAKDLAASDPAPKGIAFADLVAAGDEAVAQQNPAGALVSYRQALGINGNDPSLWMKLADLTLTRAEEEAKNNNSSQAYDFGVTGTYAAMNAFLGSQSVDERATALAALARGLERREMWRESIATYRTSLALVDNAELAQRLDDVVAQHGFRITSNEVDSEAATPRICVVFSDPLAADTDFSNYVVVRDAPTVSIEPESNQVCLTGVEHGRRYAVTVRSGLPSQNGEELRNDADLSIYVPDRSPFVGFANNAYVMPAGLGGGLPITSINAEAADLVIYRIGDRSIATAVRNGLFQRTLDQYSAEDVANQNGEKIWEGQVDLTQTTPNEMSTTAIPVSDVLTDLQPGAYVITAKVSDEPQQEYWQEMATQWFIVTDLGLTTVSGSDGVHVFARGLDDAQPVADVHLKLVAVNNEILGEATTDANGQATFAPGLARGAGGRAPQVVTAETADGDYAFLDVTKPAFDLTDRGVEGRPSPGPLDLFATTERGVYRPGETVFVTALLRDAKANAVTDLPLTMEVERPDGVVATREVLSDKGAGGYYAPVPLVSEAMRGSWTIRFYANPKEAPLTNTTFLVEDFEPERLAFEISAAETPVTLDEVSTIDVAAKYLYGATAPDLNVEADVVLRPSTSLADHPGYTFGRQDDPFQTYFQPLGSVGVTDADGNVAAEVTVPSPGTTTKPLTAQFFVRLVDTNGRPVQRTLTRPVLADVNRIGIKPQFDSGIEEGSNAGFDIITVAPEGGLVAETGLTWTLSRIETNYQWYRDGSAWKWEAITTTREVANGTVDTEADGPATVAAPVQWGRYVLDIESGGEGATSSSYEFYAGYYYAEAGSNTPDTLQVALDKPAYRVGENAVLKLDPQFAGTALVMVVDDRIIAMQAVDVPADGTSVSLPVTEEWGPGAYVTAVLYRPSSAAEKRMPARALGLAFADVDPGDRKLDVTLEVAKEMQPRAPMSVTVKVPNAKAGETAYVAVAAVDLGILNLTSFKTPDPDGWFFGQRQLGMEVRDLYGQLIDPTQGNPGAIRSGGDGESPSRLGTPPPTTVLVAQHSGVVTVGADGTATVTFDMPDFAGTVRLMAMAWTASGVGHAQADVIVRDPVVVTMSPPRFLRVDDTSRLLVEINNVAGAAGAYKVELATEEGLSTDAPLTNLELAAGARTALDLKLTGKLIGDWGLKLIVTDPSGKTLVKDLTLGVRAHSGPQTTSELIALKPGDSLTLDKSRFADLIPASGTLVVSVGPIARLDVPGVLLALDRYPYGCAEQITSRAMPLLYLNQVAEMIGLGADEAIEQRVRDAIANVLSKQTSSGGFGLWGPSSSSDLWLDSYVTEFLLRAKAEGHEVPELAMTMALDNLANQVAYYSDFEKGGEDLAYALYDLARAGRAAIGDLRYYVEARLERFGSPLAKAQLGAALSLYGDRGRAAQAFESALEDFGMRDDRYRYRPDYGSRLRDTAAILALAAEFKPSGIDLADLTADLADLRDEAKWTSTQEDAWTLLAASALGRSAGVSDVTIDGENVGENPYRRYWQETFDSETVTIANNGNQPTEVKVSVTGIPAVPPPAGGNEFTISRAYYLPDGTPVEDISEVAQNERFVVVLTMSAAMQGSGQYLVADPLPGGFEIENSDLSQGAGLSDLSWLKVDPAQHVEARTDQFVAAFRNVSDFKNFTTAYMVRAVSPGSFVLPGATVEDMYRPELRANTDAGRIEVLPAGR